EPARDAARAIRRVACDASVPTTATGAGCGSERRRRCRPRADCARLRVLRRDDRCAYVTAVGDPRRGRVALSEIAPSKADDLDGGVLLLDAAVAQLALVGVTPAIHLVVFGARTRVRRPRPGGDLDHVAGDAEHRDRLRLVVADAELAVAELSRAAAPPARDRRVGADRAREPAARDEAAWIEQVPHEDRRRRVGPAP